MKDKEYYINRVKQMLYEKYNKNFEVELLRIEITDDNKEYIKFECFKKNEPFCKFITKFHINQAESILEKDVFSFVDKTELIYERKIGKVAEEYIEDSYASVLFTKNYQKELDMQIKEPFEILVNLNTYSIYKEVPTDYSFKTYLSLDNENWVDYFFLYRDYIDEEAVIANFKNPNIMYTFFHFVKSRDKDILSKKIKKSLFDNVLLKEVLNGNGILLYKKYVYTNNKIREMI